MAEQSRHAYERACRNTQHPGCTCMHLVDGRWCDKPQTDPIHQQPADEEWERRISAMQDEDDLRGMLPYEVIAVLRNAEQRAILEAGAVLRRLLRVRLDEDEELADYGPDLSEQEHRAMEARIAEQQNALDAWDAALGAMGEGR